MKKVIFFLIALLIIISTAIFQKKLNNSKSETVTKYEKIDISPGEDIYTYKDYIYIYGKSGIKIYHNTNEIFTESFLMENIYTVSSNDKIILGDKQGKTLRIYNKKGNMYSINHTNPIISFTVNQNGYAAFIAKASSSYEILVYNDLGENIFSLTNITYKEGIPINLSLSNNFSLAVSFLKIDASIIETDIAIYSLLQDENTNNSMFGAFKKTNQLAGIIKFLDTDNLLVLSDKELSIISVNANNNYVNEAVKIPFNNKIDFISFLDNSKFVLYYDEELIQTEENKIPKNTAIIYNSNGRKVSQITFNNNITNVFSNKLGFIVAKDRLFTGYASTGEKIFEYQATQDIKSMQFFNSNNKALLVTENEIRIFELNKKNIKLLEKNNTEPNKSNENNKNNAPTENGESKKNDESNENLKNIENEQITENITNKEKINSNDKLQ